ncbi:hypothetical protein SK3146_04067 [Paenibacillus konkukensis]|uniref:Uncharacterized protein n=1 Tax=Paenibacillus konkukensis TaxID=2020716 RepID=A0ABY4RS80_9BACL|nr:hypothetical protein SK3146_04067 [Paenibacillus konkukensis]
MHCAAACPYGRNEAVYCYNVRTPALFSEVLRRCRCRTSKLQEEKGAVERENGSWPRPSREYLPKSGLLRRQAFYTEWTGCLLWRRLAARSAVKVQTAPPRSIKLRAMKIGFSMPSRTKVVIKTMIEARVYTVR